MTYVCEVWRTKRFDEWMAGLRDDRVVAAIGRRIERLRRGNFGLRRVLGEGVWELKLDIGPGYRIYYRLQGRTLVLLLCGGDKGSQRNDIALALRLARELEASDGA